MSQNLSTYSIRQKPDVINPNLFDVKSHRKLDSLPINKKFMFKWLRQIGTVSQKQTAIITAQFLNYVDIMNIGCYLVKGLNHIDGANFYMRPKTVKRFIVQIFATTCYASEKYGVSDSESIGIQKFLFAS